MQPISVGEGGGRNLIELTRRVLDTLERSFPDVIARLRLSRKAITRQNSRNSVYLDSVFVDSDRAKYSKINYVATGKSNIIPRLNRLLDSIIFEKYRDKFRFLTLDYQ